jgi:oxaloacetate decarboxylase gamma subunit
MSELLVSGVELMIVGMGIVYLFLTVLVILMKLMSALLQRFFPAKPFSAPGARITSPSGIDKSTIAAITAAVHQYRKKP